MMTQTTADSMICEMLDDAEIQQLEDKLLHANNTIMELEAKVAKLEQHIKFKGLQ